MRGLAKTKQLCIWGIRGYNGKQHFNPIFAIKFYDNR